MNQIKPKSVKKSASKIIVITGPTASGKTALAIKLAKKIDAEIICADSRIVYRGLDIVSAKPDIIEQDGVPHHLIDIKDPVGEPYSAGDFANDAKAVIEKIKEKNNISPKISYRLFLILVLPTNSSTLSSLLFIVALSLRGCSNHLLKHLAPMLVRVLSNTHKSVAFFDASLVFSQISKFLRQLLSIIKYLLF